MASGSHSGSQADSQAGPPQFEAAFGRAPTVCYWSPGRVNLIGEHTDYNSGWVLPFAVPFGVTAYAAPRDDGVLAMVSAQMDDEPIRIPLDELAPRHPDGWAAYVAGMAWVLRREGHALTGADILVDGDVPAGAGLSSSAALECAAGAALCAAQDPPSAGGIPAEMQLALLASTAENDYVGAPTGIMDQAASVLCRADHALLLDCLDRSTSHLPLGLADKGLAIVVVDTQVHHQHSDGEYAARRTECELAASVLGVASLRSVSADDLAAAESTLRSRLDGEEAEVVSRRLRHIVTENDRVLAVARLLKAGAVEQIGPVLTESHRSMQQDFQISCAELDSAVEASLGAGALGARMTGGGFGGSAIALVPTERVDQLRVAVAEAANLAGLTEPRTFTVDAVDGLHQRSLSGPGPR